MGSGLPKTKLLCSRAPLHALLGSRNRTLFLKIRENCHGNCLGSRAPSFQNDGLQGSSDPLWGPLKWLWHAGGMPAAMVPAMPAAALRHVTAIWNPGYNIIRRKKIKTKNNESLLAAEGKAKLIDNEFL